MFDRAGVRLEPWGEGDLPLLQKCLGDPAMMEHLGGPMSAEQIFERQQHYEQLPQTGQGRMFKIVETATGERVGSVGYWERETGKGRVYETGWLVLTAIQGRGVATSATAQAIERARTEGKHRYLYAYPSVETHPQTRSANSLASRSSAQANTRTRPTAATSIAATTGASTCSQTAERRAAGRTRTSLEPGPPLEDP
jgi:RimJ/RimL family protein N-acetyltransferase